jgi:hypothetical protein
MTTKKAKSKELKFDYKTIKSFEDACKRLKLDPKKLPEVPLDDLAKPIIAVYKLTIIYKAINDGWIPDWANYDQYKYYPWYGVLSSGFGFSYSYCSYSNASTDVGSRLCTDSKEKALYIAEQFKDEYQDFLLLTQ